MDRDGHLDVVVVNSADWQVQVLGNYADGGDDGGPGVGGGMTEGIGESASGRNEM